MTRVSLPSADRETCAYCPKLCRHDCPVAEAERTELATPTFKQQVALRAASGEAPLDAERARVLYKCTGCGASASACRHDIDVGPSLREARGLAARAGVAPPEVERLRARFSEHGGPYRGDLRELARQRLGPLKTQGASALFPACGDLIHETDVGPQTLNLLMRSGRPCAPVLPAPGCCGYPLDALGLEREFRTQAARIATGLRGFEEVIFPGPGCAYTVGVRYRELGIATPFRVVPLVDALVATHSELWSAENPFPPYAYHDPCHLGRHLGRYAQPRRLLLAATGRAPVELGLNRDRSLCSGGGGGYPLTHRDGATSCAQRVIELFKETPAEVLVTACPTAHRQLQRGAPDRDVRRLEQVLAERAAHSPA